MGARRGSERWDRVQFACAFAVVGFVTFLSIDPPFDDFLPHLAKTLVLATLGGCVAGRFGDAAWEGVAWVARRFWWL